MFCRVSTRPFLVTVIGNALPKDGVDIFSSNAKHGSKIGSVKLVIVVIGTTNNSTLY